MHDPHAPAVEPFAAFDNLYYVGPYAIGTWILDTGFDDVAVWRTIWEQEQHVVCRLKHKDRLIKHQNEQGQWVNGNIQGARQRLQLLATARTEMVVRRGRQRKAKRQPVGVEIRACPIR